MRIARKPIALLAVAALLGVTASARAQDEQKAKTVVYGFVQTDAGYWTKPVNPDWFDVQRPTKLPSYENQYGKDGNTYFSVRQTRFGVKSYIPTEKGELQTTFEFDMFGVGGDAGQTTIRPRVFYGQLGKFGAGQIASAFMDLDVFPNCLDYWGPNGMLFYRNVQVRYMPIQGNKSLTIALERPGASGDAGVYSDRIEVAGVTPNFPLPDLSANYHLGTKWGYVQVGGIVRDIEWQGTGAYADSINGSVTGWGVTLSTNLKAGTSDVFRGQVTYGEGVQNYFNDAPVDVALKTNASGPPDAVALPITGFSIFDDHAWNGKWSTTFGYSMVNIDNSSGQTADAYHIGHYALANLLYTPDPKIMCGFETGYEKRENNSDDFTSESWRFAFSFKYSFSGTIFGGDK
jgi:hypothetical protein